MMDREKCYVDGKPKSGYLWCSECGRVYPYGSYKEKVYRLPEEFSIELRTAFFYMGITPSFLRDIDGSVLQMCPYPGCDGDTVMDAWDWEDVRSSHPEYPEIPEDGVVYHLG